MLKSKILLDVNFQGHKGREQKKLEINVMIAHVKREKLMMRSSSCTP